MSKEHLKGNLEIFQTEQKCTMPTSMGEVRMVINGYLQCSVLILEDCCQINNLSLGL
jgi:hypothetical protein